MQVLYCQLYVMILSDVWLEPCGLLVNYVFIHFLDSHSDGTHSLQRIHWWDSDVMLNFSKSDLIYIFDGLGVTKFNFKVNYSFKSVQT